MFGIFFCFFFRLDNSGLNLLEKFVEVSDRGNISYIDSVTIRLVRHS